MNTFRSGIAMGYSARPSAGLRRCNPSHAMRLSQLPLARLAASMAALFALSPSAVIAATLPVSNCNDAGNGSLRAVVAAANSGDTVDMSNLNCGIFSSGITLTTGAIAIAQGSLTLQGPSSGHIEITGWNGGGSIEADRILYHTGTGVLALQNIGVSYGRPYSTSNISGGCIFSAGTVVMTHSRVSSCIAQTDNVHTATGGGLRVAGNLVAKYSTISNNTAQGGTTLGGGAMVARTFTATNSTVDGNTAANIGTGGGVVAYKGAGLSNVTISNNTSGFIGGMIVRGNPATDSVSIVNSTISGNLAVAAQGRVGGVEIVSVPTTIQYSTIAFNGAVQGKVAKSGSGFYYEAPGLALLSDSSGAFTATVQSSLLSNNTYGLFSYTEADFSVATSGANTITVNASINLIRASSGPTNPGSISVQCPLLGPLRDNGGPTRTHALLSHSPAIDGAGTTTNLQWDQRGSPYARLSGPAADVGAYEVQKADVIFDTGFEGCPPLS